MHNMRIALSLKFLSPAKLKLINLVYIERQVMYLLDLIDPGSNRARDCYM